MKPIKPNDPETLSADLVSENVGRVRELFPEVFSEGRLDVHHLCQLLGVSSSPVAETFGLSWHGKRSARQLALTPTSGTLRPCPDESADWSITKNLIIEGDNLEVLKLLQKSYAGQVKLIYIDPPYNTGHDFVYPDTFQDPLRHYLALTGQVTADGVRASSNTEASGRFHTHWLNMMLPRLRLARNLLRENGVIFISIDDHEVDHLRLLCSEVFGAENFLACIVWERADSPRMDADYFSTKHDYVLCFAKSAEFFSVIRKPYEGDAVPQHFNKLDPSGRRYYLKPLRAMGGQGETRAARPNLYYPITAPDGSSVYPKLEGGGDGAWRWSRRKLAQEIGRVEWTQQDGQWTPYYRIFADESAGKPPETMWFAEDVGSTRTATAEVKSLFDDVKVFDTPKPIALIRQILQLTTGPEDIVLDFFAGSGTTGHAVLEQNAEDGGKRRFILVQLPQSLDINNREQKTAADFCTKLRRPLNIAELTKERVRRSGRSIKQQYPLFAGDIGFRVFRLATSNIRPWTPDPQQLAATLFSAVDHIESDRSTADILSELLLKLGLDLCVPIATRTIAKKEVHSVGAGTLMVCLDKHLQREVVEPLAIGIAAWHRELSPATEATVIFQDSAFVDDVAKSNLVAILQQHGLTNVRSL
jgi:adenine-specific DNA-methyltransferase